MTDPGADLAHLQAENDRLRAALDRRERRGRVLARISGRVHGRLDLTAVVQAVLEEICFALDADRCAVDLAVDLPDLARHFVSQPADATPGADNGRPLTVPILFHHELLGTLTAHRAAQPWRDEALQFATQSAQGLAMLLANARLLAENENRARQIDALLAQTRERAAALETLLAFSADLNEQLDPQRLLRRLVEHAAQLVGAQGGFGALVDAATGPGARAGYRDGRWRPLPAPAGDVPLPAWLAAHRRSHHFDDYARDPLADPALKALFPIRTAVAIPILDAGDTLLGYFELHDRHDDEPAFTAAEVEMLASLASAAAVALHNSRLFRELETQQSQLRALSAQSVALLEEERARIARELHDEAGQRLIGLKLNLQVLARRLPPDLREEADGLRQQLNDAGESLQTLAHRLRPPILAELGLVAALHRLADEVERGSGLLVRLENDGLGDRLPEAVETACYRIVQEALTNVVRHAETHLAWVAVTRRPHAISLSVRDEGRGFDPARARAGGLGILGMRERATMLGGHLRLVSAEGRGTTVQAVLPLSGEAVAP